MVPESTLYRQNSSFPQAGDNSEPDESSYSAGQIAFPLASAATIPIDDEIPPVFRMKSSQSERRQHMSDNSTNAGVAFPLAAHSDINYDSGHKSISPVASNKSDNKVRLPPLQLQSSSTALFPQVQLV